MNSAETQATLDIFASFGTGSFGSFSTTPTTTTTTTTTTVTNTNGCKTNEYYSFIKKKCIATGSSASAPIPDPIPEKTEAELLEESNKAINDAFSGFATSAFNLNKGGDAFDTSGNTNTETKIEVND